LIDLGTAGSAINIFQSINQTASLAINHHPAHPFQASPTQPINPVSAPTSDVCVHQKGSVVGPPLTLSLSHGHDPNPRPGLGFPTRQASGHSAILTSLLRFVTNNTHASSARSLMTLGHFSLHLLSSPCPILELDYGSLKREYVQ
jgi:hypothetical protein